jgi:hypothetical protein
MEIAIAKMIRHGFQERRINLLAESLAKGHPGLKLEPGRNVEGAECFSYGRR